MLRNKTFTCIIPARGGSKSIPNKNIRLMHGKPLIEYVIDAATSSGIFEQIVVTTDSQKIIDSSPVLCIRRPPELATDDALVADAIQHALTELPETDYVLLLEPTSPMLGGGDILRAAKYLLNEKADMVVSVEPASPDWLTTGRLGKDNSLKGFLPKDLRYSPRQTRPQYYCLNSAIYMGKWNIFKKKLDYYEQDTKAFIMMKDSSIHIDTEEDWIKVSRELKRRGDWGRVFGKSVLSNI